MNRRWMLGLALIAAAGAAGCKSLARQVFANPVVEVKDVKIRAVGFQGGSLDIILDVYNPNEFRVDARRVNYVVMVDSAQIATGDIEKLTTLDNKAHAEVVVPVNFTYQAVQKAAEALARRGSINYQVRGSFTMATPFGDITRPYSGSGRWDSLR